MSFVVGEPHPLKGEVFSMLFCSSGDYIFFQQNLLCFLRNGGWSQNKADWVFGWSSWEDGYSNLHVSGNLANLSLGSDKLFPLEAEQCSEQGQCLYFEFKMLFSANYLFSYFFTGWRYWLCN